METAKKPIDEEHLKNFLLNIASWIVDLQVYHYTGGDPENLDKARQVFHAGTDVEKCLERFQENGGFLMVTGAIQAGIVDYVRVLEGMEPLYSKKELWES